MLQEKNKRKAQGYRELRVYQEAHQLGVEIHQMSLRLPRYELYETGSQVRRSAKSISTNIVEGYGRRRYKAEFIRFLVFAHASCDETLEHLRYLRDTGLLVDEQFSQLEKKSELLSRRIYVFIQRIEEEKDYV